jgi:putative membrane protein
MATHRRFAVVIAATGLLLAVAAPALAEPNEQDEAWLAAAHQSNLSEIAAGESAQQNATTEQVREMGATLVEDHTTLDDDLVAVAEELGVDLPDAPTEEQQAILAEVEENEGEAYDAAWVAAQIDGHAATLAAIEEELAEGQDEQVIGLAETARPVVEDHYDHLTELSGTLTGVPAGTGGQMGAANPLAPTLIVTGALLLVLASAGVIAGRRRERV